MIRWIKRLFQRSFKRKPKDRQLSSTLHASLDTQKMLNGEVQDEMSLLARRFYYPRYWDASKVRKPWIVQHMEECHGVPSSDLRDLRYVEHEDAVIIRLHNGREFVADGIHLTLHERGMK